MDAKQIITDRYALYLDDCCEVMPGLPESSVHFSIYSPPFAGLYHYSSSPRDLSNNRDYGEFFDHYEFVVREIARLTMPGRGEPGRSGGRNGNLYIVIRVKDHTRLRRDGDDLHGNLAITPAQASTGGRIKIPTLDGEIDFEIPPGTSSGEVFRFEGMGLPRWEDSGCGSLYMQVRVSRRKKARSA